MSSLDFLIPYYSWIKALHVIAVISWMASMLYLPRLFVYHAGPAGLNPETSKMLKIMERRLRLAIMAPAMIATWVLGLTLVSLPGVIFPDIPVWFMVKFAALLAMSAFHGWLVRCQKAFANDKNTYSSRDFRIANEIPTVLMIVIVIMVIVRPF